MKPSSLPPVLHVPAVVLDRPEIDQDLPSDDAAETQRLPATTAPAPPEPVASGAEKPTV